MNNTNDTLREALEIKLRRLCGLFGSDHPEQHLAQQEFLRDLRSALSQPTAVAKPRLQWCESCGEGVTNFCRGKTGPCAYGFQKIPRAAPQGEAVACSCAECGKTSTKDSMWALYCLDCVQKHHLGADGWIGLVKDLCPDGIEQACDECGGDEKECPSNCVYRRARAMLNTAPQPAAGVEGVKQQTCLDCGDRVPKGSCYCKQGCVHAIGYPQAAQPEPQGEREWLPPLPAAKTISRGDEDGAIELGYTAAQMRDYASAALLSAPQAAREPLTDQQKFDMFSKLPGDCIKWTNLDFYFQGFEDAEAAHHIGKPEDKK